MTAKSLHVWIAIGNKLLEWTTLGNLQFMAFSGGIYLQMGNYKCQLHWVFMSAVAVDRATNFKESKLHPPLGWQGLPGWGTAWDFGSEEIKEMGQFPLRNGSGSVSTPHQQHIQGVGEDGLTRAIFYIYFAQIDSPRAFDTSGSSNINMPSHITAWLRSISKISSLAQICPLFWRSSAYLRAVPISQMGKLSHKCGTWQSWDCKPVPLLTHLHLVSCSSALTERNINRSDSQTGHHPWSQNTNFPLPSISAHLVNCQIFKAEIWVCIYNIWPAGKLCVHIWRDINNKWEYRWYFSIFSKHPILLDFLGLQGPI